MLINVYAHKNYIQWNEDYTIGPTMVFLKSEVKSSYLPIQKASFYSNLYQST